MPRFVLVFETGVFRDVDFFFAVAGFAGSTDVVFPYSRATVEDLDKAIYLIPSGANPVMHLYIHFVLV